MRKLAFTMVEILVVCSIMMLIFVPTYKILSHGSKSAIKGVQRNSIIMHGQQILSQIKSDLTESGFRPVNGTKHSINNIFSETSDSFGNYKISFFSYNGGIYEHQVKPTAAGPESFRLFNKIEYKIISSPDSIFKKLQRTVFLHPSHPGFTPRGKTQTLSDKVNFFEIRPETVDSVNFSRSFFRVSLQLFDQEKASADAPPPDPDKMFIAEFSETVNPIILNSIINNPGLQRNWYTEPSVPE